ncbi:hypothetical protein [Streptomyces sp. NPDC056512]
MDWDPCTELVRQLSAEGSELEAGFVVGGGSGGHMGLAQFGI